MELEIRPARPEEMDELKRVAHASLLITISAEINPELTLCAFKDGKLATSYAAWELTMRLNGGDIPVAGVTVVGTLPVYRRNGYLRKITTTHFETLYNQGKFPIAALHASRSAIYQRYGYAVIQTRNSYNIEPRYLEFTSISPANGSFRESGKDDLKLLDKLYQSFIKDRTGYLIRTDDMWQTNVLTLHHDRGLMTTVIYEEEDKPLGYIIYITNFAQEARKRLSHNLNIREIVWLSTSAYRAIWDYFKRMDLVINIAWSGVPVDDPLPHLLLEPRMLNATSDAGLMGRIIDIEKALTGRGYDEESTLNFEVIDELCPWNKGRWKLETSTDGSAIKRTNEEPQLSMPVSTLAMLYFGQISATEASRMGRLDVLKPEALSSWDKIMRTRYKPAGTDFF
ncbi:enhanced intracellular survival protein Eis [Chloroflexota bacterium]